MVKQHDGLKAVAKKHKVDLDALPGESACVFISRDKCRIKVYSSNGVLSYLRAKTSRPFDLSALNEFPKAFNVDGSFDYNKAIKLRLEKVFQEKGRMKDKDLVL